MIGTSVQSNLPWWSPQLNNHLYYKVTFVMSCQKISYELNLFFKRSPVLRDQFFSFSQRWPLNTVDMIEDAILTSDFPFPTNESRFYVSPLPPQNHFSVKIWCRKIHHKNNCSQQFNYIKFYRITTWLFFHSRINIQSEQLLIISCDIWF